MSKVTKLTKEQIETNIKEWIEWLEGKRDPIEQDIGYLKTEDGMCCLGVAAACVLKEEVKQDDDLFYTVGGEDQVLSLGQKASLGLTTTAGRFSYRTNELTYSENEDDDTYAIYTTDLAEINDGGFIPNFSNDPILKQITFEGEMDAFELYPATFKNIAKIIKAKPTGLFEDDYNLT